MRADGDDRKTRAEEGGRPFLRILAAAGLVLVAYFTLNLLINMVYGVDLSGKGVVTVIREPQYQDGQLVDEGESVVLKGVSGWVAAFAPWLALNANVLALGVIFYGLGFALTKRDEKKLPVTVFKLRIFASYLLAVSLLLVVLGLDRVYFLPHAETTGVLGWIDWYVFEFLAHVVWAVVITLFSMYFFLYGRGKGELAEGSSGK